MLLNTHCIYGIEAHYHQYNTNPDINFDILGSPLPYLALV